MKIINVIANTRPNEQIIEFIGVKQWATTVTEAEEFDADIGGLPELKALRSNSKEDHIFFVITADYINHGSINTEQYAVAYFNWHTKDICYCYEAF